MEEQTKTIRFVHNAMDKNTGAQYSASPIPKPLPASVADRFIGAGLAVEDVSEVDGVPTISVPAPHGLDDLTVSQLKDKAKADGVDVSGLHTKAELASAFSGKEKS